MAANTYVTLNIFNAVKILLNGGASRKEAAEYMNISKGTVDRIAISETFEEYRQLVNAYHYKKKAEAEKKAKEKAEKAEQAEATQDTVQPAQQEQPKQIVHNVTVQATHYMMQEMQKTNELLKFISNKLGFIVDELTK